MLTGALIGAGVGLLYAIIKVISDKQAKAKQDAKPTGDGN